MLVRLGQEVQALPRRLSRPSSSASTSTLRAGYRFGHRARAQGVASAATERRSAATGYHPPADGRLRTHRSRSSSRRSGPSSAGSVITFDPDQLTERQAELEAGDERARLLGRPGPGAEDEHRARARLEAPRDLRAARARVRGRTRPLRARPGDGRRDRGVDRAAPPRARAARGGGALQRRLRHRRRGRDAPVGHRRHRRAGLDGDDAADVRALGRRARLQGRAARGEPGRGGGPEELDVHDRGRERLRDPQGRARQAPARAPLAVRRGPPPPDVVRDRDRRAAPARRRRRSRSTRAT